MIFFFNCPPNSIFWDTKMNVTPSELQETAPYGARNVTARELRKTAPYGLEMLLRVNCGKLRRMGPNTTPK